MNSQFQMTRRSILAGNRVCRSCRSVRFRDGRARGRTRRAIEDDARGTFRRCHGPRSRLSSRPSCTRTPRWRSEGRRSSSSR